MKNLFILTIVLAFALVLSFSHLVLAEIEGYSNKDSSISDGSKSDDNESDDLEDSDNQDNESELEEEVEVEHSENKSTLRIREVEVESEMEITKEKVQNKTKLKIKLSDGTEREIKIMPETASETALARLRLKVCNESNNCIIQLKQVGEGNKTKLSYELKAEKEVKFLGMFKAKMHVESDIDAESGNVTREQKAWWSFLATN